MTFRIGVLTFAALAAGCVGATTASTPVAPSQRATAASCAARSPAEQLAAARLVFVGRMLPGASARADGHVVLGSPATVRVMRYVKGNGPRTVRVVTAVRITRNGLAIAEDGIEPRVGEIWKIYTQSRTPPYETSICGGSIRLMSKR